MNQKERDVKELIQLFGTENDKMENASEHFSTIGYKWETENTMLQLILMTGDTINPSAAIAVIAK